MAVCLQQLAAKLADWYLYGVSATRPTFITLGPSGTCHENALRHYLDFQGIDDFDLVLVEDLLSAIDRVRVSRDTYLLQCSAHLHVHLVTERWYEEVFVMDTFIYPTKELSLLIRRDVEQPSSLGIVSATRGYTDLSRWDAIVDEPSKPVVARKLLAGEYDAGLTHLHYADENPDKLWVKECYGAVDTTWLIYGRRKRFAGKVIGLRAPWLYEVGSESDFAEEEAAAEAAAISSSSILQVAPISKSNSAPVKPAGSLASAPRSR